MKLCDAHREELYKQLGAAGLLAGHEVTDPDVVRMLADDISNRPVTKSIFHPLRHSSTLLFSQALHSGGAYTLCFDENGNEYCPVCEADKHEFYGWIESAVKATSEFAKKL